MVYVQSAYNVRRGRRRRQGSLLSSPPRARPCTCTCPFPLPTHAHAPPPWRAQVIKANEREIPWLYRYIRKSFRFWMRQVREQRKEPDTYVDIDGIAEVCDCLRGCGMSEASDPMLLDGTLYMLRVQRKKGDWPAVLPGDEPGDEALLDSYHRIHPTWVCTQALRDRDFKENRNVFWGEHIAKVLRDSKFATLAYKPGW